MNSGDIAFPHLGIYLTDVPNGFNIGSFHVAFYGLIIGCSMLIGIFVAAALAKRDGLKPDYVWDFALYAIVLSVIGARIYYVIFAWDYYKDDWKQIFNIRQGGLAIYGGVITAFIVIFAFSKVKKIRPAQLGDVAMPALILGQALGRWGNFFNREVFGEYTDNFLAMQLPVADVRARDISESIAAHMEAGQNYIQVHPTFLYESLWNLALFVILVLYFYHRKFYGEVALLYLGGYGIGRFWIEGIRTDTLFVPGTTVPVSQVVAIIMILIALVGEIVIRMGIKKGKIAPYVKFHPTSSTEGEKSK